MTGVLTALAILAPIAPPEVDVATSWWDTISIGQFGLFGLFLITAGGLVRLYKKLSPLENFFKDWNGEVARPGVKSRPGVLVRMESIEGHVDDSVRRVEFAKLSEQVVRNTAVLNILAPVSVAKIVGDEAIQKQQVVQDGRLDNLEDTP